MIYQITHSKERMVILIIAIMQFAHLLDFVIMMPLGPYFMKEFDITANEFGFLVSSYTFSAGLSSLLASLFLDKFDRKHAILFIFSGFILGTFFCGLPNSYAFLITARIVAGGFGGMVGVMVLSIIGDLIPHERKGKATGIVMSAFSIASVAGVPIGLLIAEAYSWRTVFISLAAFSFLLLIPAYIFLPEMNLHRSLSKNKNVFQLWKTVLSDKSSYNTFFIMVCLMFGGFTIIPFIAPFLTNNLKLEVSDLKYVYFVGGLFTFFTSRLIGILSDKYGKVIIFRVISFISFIPILILTHSTAMSFFHIIILMTIFMIFVSGRIVPAFALITSSIKPEIRGGFMSMNSAIQQGASGLATIVASSIIVTDPEGLIYNYERVGYVAVTAGIIAIWRISKIKIV
jgi:predicted MFS family arabinose efflux permease